jgi:DNA-binding NarL/FixJ family response regulator
MGRMVEEDVLREITPLEERIIEQVARGRRNAEIAEALNLTMHQVRQRIGILLGDLGLPDPDALVAWRQRCPPPPLAVRITYRRNRLPLAHRAKRLLRFQ